jgi:sec-independent protein translocase protein TatB
MFDIGFWELIVIAVIGLLVLGPERLPSALRSVLKWIGTIKGAANQITQELQQEINLQKLQEDLKTAERSGLNDLNRELQQSVDTLRGHAAELQRPYQVKSDGADDTAPLDLLKDDKDR